MRLRLVTDPVWMERRARCQLLSPRSRSRDTVLSGRIRLGVDSDVRRAEKCSFTLVKTYRGQLYEKFSDFRKNQVETHRGNSKNMAKTYFRQDNKF